jgi:3-methylcrotonyl-CoA carboxylase beta subunit
VLAQVRRDALEKQGRHWPAEEEARFKQPIAEQYARQSAACYATARLWDDGIIEPTDTRRVLAAALTLSAHAPIEQTRFGVFRM